jgi:very-short-patch-repair endonuclease
MPPDELGTLFTRSMARAVGYSDGQIRRRIGSGRWTFVAGHVLASVGVEITPRLRDRAAATAIPDCVLSGPSAARWQDIDIADDRTWITVPPGRRIRLDGVHIRREHLAASDIVRHAAGLAMTAVDRTVFDCVRLLPLDRAERLLIRALDERWIAYEAFLHRVGQHTGRHGMAHLVTLVSRLAYSRQVDPVTVLADRLRRAGITGWRTRQPFRGQAVDLVFDRPRLAVDCGGGSWHNGVVRAGWTVLRYSRAQVLEQTDDVIAEVIAVRDQLSSGRRRL